jgi:Holliday junction resolvase RusA-like endonuclease
MIPRPQKQTLFGKKKAYDPSKQQKQAIQWQIRPYAPKEPLNTPLSVDITFYLPIPKGTAKLLKQQMINQTVYPTKRPDIDNLAYIVTNAMKDIVYVDDSQVVDLILRKRYSDTPKTVIKVLEL